MSDHARASVAVVICAYTPDRWNQLTLAVASAQAQRRSADEVIVVIDHAPGLLERAVGRFTNCTVLPSTGAPGLSAARNTGIMASRADIVAFLDDDAQAEPGWLSGLARAFDDPRVLGCGGVVTPMWTDGRRPVWFPPAFDWVVGCTYEGYPTKRTPVRNVLGCNMAFRRSALIAADGFRGNLGRIGTNPVGAEETDLCIRLRAANPGAEILFVPEAAVDHAVPRERATWRYFIRRCFGEGLSKSVLTRSVGSAALSDETRYVRNVLPRAMARAVVDAIRGRRPALLARAAAVMVGLSATTAGFCWGVLRRRDAAAPALREAR